MKTSNKSAYKPAAKMLAEAGAEIARLKGELSLWKQHFKDKELAWKHECVATANLERQLQAKTRQEGKE